MAPRACGEAVSVTGLPFSSNDSVAAISGVMKPTASSSIRVPGGSDTGRSIQASRPGPLHRTPPKSTTWGGCQPPPTKAGSARSTLRLPTSPLQVDGVGPEQLAGPGRVGDRQLVVVDGFGGTPVCWRPRLGVVRQVAQP